MNPLTFDLGENEPSACGHTRLTLRRYHAGELAAEQRAALGTHLENCIDCQAIMEELRSDDAAFRTHIPFNRFVADHEKRAASQQPVKTGISNFWKWLMGGGVTAALAIGAAMMLMVPKPVATPEEEVWTGLKGKTVGIGFLVRTPTGVRAGHSDEQLREGDQIHFMVKSPPQKGSLVVLGIDGKGAVTVYHSGPPPDGATTAAAPLPDSVVLDDAVGRERFFAVVAPGNPEDLRKAAEQAANSLAEKHVDLQSVETLPLGKDAQQDSVLIVKVR